MNDPIALAGAVVGGAALLAVAYLLGVVALAVCARLGGADVRRLLVRWTVPCARGLVTAVLSAGLSLPAAAAAQEAAEPPPELVLRRLPAPATPAAATAAEPTAPPAQPVAAAESTWTVRPGDSFWRITEERLRAHLGREPRDDEVDGPWRALVEANRDRLIDRTNPDLLHPGQTLRLTPM